jgi:hypothetical protein
MATARVATARTTHRARRGRGAPGCGWGRPVTGSDDDQHISRLVRPYALTGGRTRPRVEIAIESLLVATPRGLTAARTYQRGSTESEVLALCGRGPMALAEIAAHTRLPLGVARILVADLMVEGLLALAGQTYANAQNPVLLGRVLSGLRRL